MKPISQTFEVKNQKSWGRKISGLFVISFLIFFGYCSSLEAQLILPSENNGFDQYPNFNFEYIRQHRIKSITFDILDKKDLEVAVDRGLINIYEFDSLGRLTRFYYTLIGKTIVKEYHQAPVVKHHRVISKGGVYYKNDYSYDTISTRFFYDAANRLKLKRYNDGNYYEAYYYEYDSLGRVIHELRARESNASTDKNLFQLGKQNIISDERFEYQSTGKMQYKKKCLNDEGRVYKEIIVNMNERGQVLRLNESFTVTWINQETLFTYNENNQLTEKNYQSNSSGMLYIKDTFEYDAKGNILTEKQYKNDVLQNELSYLFDESDNKVKSFLNRDYINKSIRITKLLYTLW